MPDREADLRAGLEEVGAELADLARRREAAMERAARLAAEGHAAGLDIKAMSQLLGLSRPTLYRLLEGRNAE